MILIAFIIGIAIFICLCAVVGQAIKDNDEQDINI